MFRLLDERTEYDVRKSKDQMQTSNRSPRVGDEMTRLVRDGRIRAKREEGLWNSSLFRKNTICTIYFFTTLKAQFK